MRPSQQNVHQILAEQIPALFQKSVADFKQKISALKTQLAQGPLSPDDIASRQLRKYESRFQEFQAVDVSLLLKLEGEGGGDYGFHLKNGKLKIETPLKKAPDFTVLQTVGGFKETIMASASLEYSLFDPAKKPFPFPNYIAKSHLEQLRPLAGGLRFVVAGEFGWETLVFIGPPGIAAPLSLSLPTRATISLKYRDFIDLARGELHPEKAVITGRFKIIGDFGYVLRLAKLMVGILGLS